jgi:hypothetical protein
MPAGVLTRSVPTAPRSLDRGAVVRCASDYIGFPTRGRDLGWRAMERRSYSMALFCRYRARRALDEAVADRERNSWPVNGYPV